MENIRDKRFYDDNGDFFDIYDYLRLSPIAPTDTVLKEIESAKDFFLQRDPSAKDDEIQAVIGTLNYFENIFRTDRESYDAEYAKAMTAPEPAPAEGRLSQEEIERLLAGEALREKRSEPVQTGEPTPAPTPEPTPTPAQPGEPVTPRQEARSYTPEELNDFIKVVSQAIAQAQNAINNAQPAAPAQTGEPTPAPAPEPTPAPAPEPTPAPTPEPTPTPDDGEDYETLEARTKAAFDREQDEKIAKLKGQAEEQRRQAEERVNNAKATVEEAKATKDREKDEVKRAKKAVKEARKETRKAKWDAFKAKLAEKKAKKEIKKINKKRQKRKVLIREPKRGIVTGFKEHWKQITAGVLAISVFGGGAWAIKHGIINIDLGGKDNEPTTSQSGSLDPTGTQTPNPQNPTATPAPTPEQIQNAAEEAQGNFTAVENNLKNLDIEESYSEEDAVELVKFLNGQESTLTADQANDMLENIVTSVVTPAINNALAGEQVYETQGISLAQLLANDPAYGAVQAMEDYINGSIEHPEQLSDYARRSLEDQVRIINIGETVNGFNIVSTSPAARLVWANLAAGMNGLAGTLGEDFIIEINGVTYAHNEINNGTILQMVINSAKKDLGLSANAINLK